MSIKSFILSLSAQIRSIQGKGRDEMLSFGRERILDILKQISFQLEQLIQRIGDGEEVHPYLTS